jgi:hypothetical protein
VTKKSVLFLHSDDVKQSRVYVASWNRSQTCDCVVSQTGTPVSLFIQYDRCLFRHSLLQQQHPATVQLVTNMNNAKSQFLQYFPWQWYQLTCYTFHGCIFTPRRCKIMKIINNQPCSGPVCCFVNNMTKSHENIKHYASTPIYRIYIYLLCEQCNCFERCKSFITEVIYIRKTLKMTSCTEFSEANLLDIVT